VIGADAAASWSRRLPERCACVDSSAPGARCCPLWNSPRLSGSGPARFCLAGDGAASGCTAFHGRDARATPNTRARRPCHSRHGRDARATSEPDHVAQASSLQPMQPGMAALRSAHGRDARATSTPRARRPCHDSEPTTGGTHVPLPRLSLVFAGDSPNAPPPMPRNFVLAGLPGSVAALALAAIRLPAQANSPAFELAGLREDVRLLTQRLNDSVCALSNWSATTTIYGPSPAEPTSLSPS